MTNGGATMIGTALHRSRVELFDRIGKGAHFWSQNFDGKWSTVPHSSKLHAQKLKELKALIGETDGKSN